MPGQIRQHTQPALRDGDQVGVEGTGCGDVSMDALSKGRLGGHAQGINKNVAGNRLR